MNEDTQQNMELTAQEEAFCDLYVHGGMEFAGQILKCYRKIFGGTASMRDSAQARSLLLQPRMMARVKEMISTEQYEMETAAVKLQIAETLKAVMAEAATQNYIDRFGAPLSPASVVARRASCPRRCGAQFERRRRQMDLGPRAGHMIKKGFCRRLPSHFRFLQL